MARKESLLETERRLWNADEEFYEEHLAPDAVMVFPAPTGIVERSEVLDSLGGEDRWASVDIRNERFLELGDGPVQLIYEAVAERAASDAVYRASITTTYVAERDSWLVASHQQTPVHE